MMFEAQTEWIAPDNFPDLSGYKLIAIDLETRDPDLKSKGSGAVIGNGEIIGVAVAVGGELSRGLHLAIDLLEDHGRAEDLEEELAVAIIVAILTWLVLEAQVGEVAQRLSALDAA